LSGAAVEATRRAAARTPPALSGAGFLWPAKGELASGFGEKPNGARNNGINISAVEGTAVLAAENGIVVYAGSGISGYGNMLLISHAGSFMTTYAHNRDLRVAVGDLVRRGQEIATVGATGGLAVPQLHFEIRQGKKPLDPMLHLAGAAGTRVASTR
jgi:murein DD-endopeptidase MepM/ murein hydrolase activator NlpD